ncbi:hypothetical protein MBLNU13_g09640t1 [Cladosporium sp. NU13]
MDDHIMEHLKDRYLDQAQQQGRFSRQKSQFYISKIRDGHATTVTSENESNIQASTFDDWRTTFAEGWDNKFTDQSIFNFIFQPSRPKHVSGNPDTLPFQDLAELRSVFDTLRLPSSYFQIASGSVGSAQSHTLYDSGDRPYRHEMIGHCVSQQGDWALALSHDAAKRVTSVFWSVEKPINSKALLDDFHAFQKYASHPMLIPCIMFASSLRTSEERRQSIKDRLVKLESTIAKISVKEAHAFDHDMRSYGRSEHPQSLETLLQILHSCRKDQSSRKGRYKFWRSVVDSIEEGFKYIEAVMAHSPDIHLLEAHRELRKWVRVNEKKLESLMARDEDHVDRVENVSHMLYSLVGQRDIRIQSSIARATQRDSEDMKFIAVLGSIFLPASLIATILNVPDFGFAQGATLFGAYIGITVPLVAVVMLLCLRRLQLIRWIRKPSSKSSTSSA